MNKFIYEIKGTITQQQLLDLKEDIAKGNEEAKKMFHNVHKKMNSRVIRYSVGWTQFAKHLALNAEYLSNMNIIEDYYYNETKFTIEVNDVFLSLIGMGESLGINQIRESFSWIKSRFGIENTFKPDEFTKSGFSKYIIKALKDNGIDAKEEAILA